MTTLQPEDLTPAIRPVIFEGHRDGLLLGVDFRLPIVNFEVDIGGAYGLASRAARFRVGLDYARMMSFYYGDWPESPVLGRQGEQGYHVSLDLLRLYRLVQPDSRDGILERILAGSRFRGTGFLGQLWPEANEDEGPSVQYAHLSALVHWPVLPGLTVDTAGDLLMGRSSEDPTRIFQTFTSSSVLRWQQVALEIRAGEVENPGGLAGLQLDLGLRSYPSDFAADRFVLAKLERTFGFFTQRLFIINLTGILGPELGWISVELRADVSVFFEGGVILNEVDELQVDQIFFGWGASLLFPDLQMRIDLAVNRDGSPTLMIETGLLP